MDLSPLTDIVRGIGGAVVAAVVIGAGAVAHRLVDGAPMKPPLPAREADSFTEWFLASPIPEPPAVCEPCGDLGSVRLADVLTCGKGYCVRHAFYFAVPEHTRATLRARELGVTP